MSEKKFLSMTKWAITFVVIIFSIYYVGKTMLVAHYVDQLVSDMRVENQSLEQFLSIAESRDQDCVDWTGKMVLAAAAYRDHAEDTIAVAKKLAWLDSLPINASFGVDLAIFYNDPLTRTKHLTNSVEQILASSQRICQLRTSSGESPPGDFLF